MYLSITCYFIQHTRLTINSLCLFQFEYIVVPEGFYCSIHSYGIQSKDT